MFSFDDLTQLDGYKNAPEEEQQQIKAAYASDFWKDFTSTKEFSSLPSDEREKYATLFDQRFSDVDGISIRAEAEKRIMEEDDQKKGDESLLSSVGRGGMEAIKQVPQLGWGVVAGSAAAGETALDSASERLRADGHDTTAGILDYGQNALKNAKEYAVGKYVDSEKDMSKDSRMSDSFDYSYSKAKNEGDYGSLLNWGAHGLGYVGAQAIELLTGAGIAEKVAEKTLQKAAGKYLAGMVEKEASKLAEESLIKEGIAATTENIAAKASSEEIGKAATKNIAGFMGQQAAAATFGYGMEGGEIGGDLAKQSVTENRELTGKEVFKGISGTFIAGTLEYAENILGLTAMKGKLPMVKAIEGMGGAGGRIARGAMGAAEVSPLEAGQEWAQTYAEQWGEGKPTDTKAAAIERSDSAALGAIGGVMGAGGGILSGPRHESVKSAPSDILKTDSIDTAIDTFNQAVTGSMGNIDAKLSGMEQELNQQYAPEQAPAPGGSLGSKVPVASSADLNDIGRQSQDSPGGGTGDIANAHSPDPFTDYSTDSLMNDFSEQGQDVQGQSDTRGRKIQLDRMMEPVNNQVLLAENSTGRPSTAEEAARAFEQNPPTPKMLQVDDREGRADAFRSVQPWMTDEEIKQRGVELLHDSMPKNGEGSVRAGRSTAQEDLSTPYEGKLIDEKFQDNKTVSTNPGWTDSVNRYYDDMGLTKDSKDRTSIGYDDARATMKAVKAGKTLTDNQKNVYAFMEHAGSKLPELAREVAINRLENKGYDFNKNPETIAVGRLAEGDKVVTTDKFGNPVEFTHKGMDEKGNAILQDHTTIHADPFEPLTVIDSKIADKSPIQETKAPSGNQKEQAIVPVNESATHTPIAIGQQNDNQKGGDFNGNKTQEEGQGRGRLLDQQPTENAGADTVAPVVEQSGQSIPEGSFTGKNNKPFKSEKSLLTTARLKKVDLSSHEVISYDGGFIAIPKAKDNVASNGSEQSMTQNVDSNPSNQVGVQSSGHEIVEHVTRKGKTLRGVVANDLNFKQAHRIFPFTFKKDGGYFIREDHLDKLDAYRADNAQINAASIQPEQSTVSKTAIDQVKTEPPMNPETDHTLEKPGGLITAGHGSSQSASVNDIAGEPLAKSTDTNPETVTKTTQKSEPSTEVKAKHDNDSWPDSTDTGKVDNAGRDEATSQDSTQLGSNDNTVDGQSAQGSGDKQADVSVENIEKPASEMTTADKDKAESIKKEQALDDYRLSRAEEDLAKAEAVPLSDIHRLERARLINIQDAKAIVESAKSPVGSEFRADRRWKDFTDVVDRGFKYESDTVKPSQVSNLKPEKTTQEQDRAKEKNIAAPDKGKIEDFGEKILGAKKEYAAAFKDKQDRSSDVDISAEPLSISWPEPEYNKLIESGANSEAVALFRAMRDEVPPKPRKWGVSRWVEQVKALRESAYRLLDDPEYLARFQAETKKTEHLKIDDVVNGRAALYQLVGHEKSLRGIRVSRHEYSLYDGVEYKPAKVVWSVEKEPSVTSFGNWPKQISTGDTRQEAIDGFVSKYSTMDEGKVRNDVSFGIYSDKTANGDGFFIGKKVGRNVVRIKTKFGSVVEARKYLANNKEELIKILEAKKAVPRERYDINQPRVGVDMRNAQDVTPEMFQDAFGFRGVQFGNYVEGSRRQKDLNDAYDALMDMAAVLDIPVKALSLNGELGLAFGARGSGGKNAASAHYESGQIVINLTKGNGAGSLAHEWWHGLSNYFSRMRGNADGYMTGGKERDVNSASHGGDFLAKDGVRREMVQAFGDVVRAINSTGMRERASSLDKRRTKEYWGTGEEMAARSFERFIIAKLQDQGAANDYLANVVSEEYWNAEDALGIGEGGSYPYPTVSELPKIRAGFDNFFQVIESKQTDTGVALYSQKDTDSSLHDSTGNTVPQVVTELRSFLGRGYDRLVNRGKLEVARTADELPEGTRPIYDKGGAIAGFYDPKTGKVYLIADSIKSGEAKDVFIHEAAHALLREDKTFMASRDKIMADFARLERIGSQKIREAMVRVPEDTGLQDGETYDTLTPERKVEVDALRREESLTYFLQSNPQHGLFKRIIATVKAALFRMGIPMGKLNEADMVELFKQGAKSWANGRKDLSKISQSKIDELHDNQAGSYDGIFTSKNKANESIKEIYNDGFWNNLKQRMGRAYSPSEFVAAVSGIDRRTGRRSGVNIFRQGGESNALDAIRWEDEIAGEHGYTSSASWLKTSTGKRVFEVSFTPNSLIKNNGDLYNYSLLNDISALSISFAEQGNGEYEIGISGPIKGGSAYNLLKGSGKVEDLAGVNYGRLKLNDSKAATHEFLREAVRRLAINIGETPKVSFTNRETGINAGKPGFKRLYDQKRIESLFAKQYGISVEEAKKQYDDVVARLGEDAWVKAKNTGKTKLNERQFYQVRTEAFKKWFGDWETENGTTENKQRITGDNRQLAEADTGATGNAGRVWRLHPETGEPVVFYHGSQADIKEFDLDHPNRKDKGWMGRGIYTISSPFLADSYSNLKAGDDGRNSMPLFVSVRNPYLATLDLKQELRFASQDKIDEFTKQAIMDGHDGVALVFRDGTVELMAVSPSQVKSAIGNTGQYSLHNNDIRYSIAADDKTSPLSIERIQEVAKKIGKYSAVYTDSGKPDTSIISRIFQTPEYYFNKIPALGRMMEAALDRATLRFNYENKILGKDFIQYTLNLQKINKVEYDLANDYLVDTDQTRHAFGLKNVGDGWQVLDREGNKLKDSDGNEIGKYEDEQEAVKGMMQAEHDDLIDKGYSKEAAKAVLLARKVLNTEFDMRIADMRKIEEEYKRNGMPSPFVSDKDTDGEGMYGIYAKGKGKAIALFSTEEDAKVALGNAAKFISYVVTSKDGKEHWFASEMRASRWVKAHGGAVDSRTRFENLSVRKRTEKEMRPLTLTQAMAQMGDLRGSYFPRIRPSGEYVLIAKKKGENSRREHFDVPVAGEKWGKKGEAVNWTMALVGKLSPNAASRMAELKGQGYTVEFKKDDSPVEEVFDAAKLISSVDAIIADNLDKINKNDSDEVKAAVHVDSILTLQIADIFKGRGALSSRMKRLDGDQVWEGYETDMLMAITQSAKNTAAGSAKRDTASAMIRAFTGRDFDYQDYKDQQKEQGLAPSWDEYMKIVDDRKVHSGKQKNGYRDGRAFMIDVLRNSEHADRIMGTLQGLAVNKFLGFRVSSAAVNITNMVTGVPGTISGMTGDSIHTALGRVMGAASAYGKFRSGKGELSVEDRDIFQYIVDNGWDEAQFNHEAMSVLLSKSGAVWSKFTNDSMWMFGAIEKVNRATTIHAAYKAIMAKNPSKGFEVAMKEAEHISNQAHGVYGKETLPMWARGRINPLRMLYTFQKFSHNYMMNMYDIGWNKKQYKAAAYIMLSPAILGGAGASLATPVLMALAGALGVGGDDPEEEFYKWSAENLGSDTIARHGLAGLAGVNLKASLGSNVSMPTKIPELFGAPGAVVTDVWKAGQLFSKGEVSKGAEVLLPTAFGSMFKAVREGSEGISTGNYGTVFYGNEPLKADTWDAILRFFSFNPARISGIREKQWNEKQVAARYQERKNEIYSEIKRLHLQDEPYLTPETLKEVSRYNELVKGSGRRDIKPITPQGIRLMLRRSNRASKFERNRALDDIAVNE